VIATVATVMVDTVVATEALSGAVVAMRVIMRVTDGKQKLSAVSSGS